MGPRLLSSRPRVGRGLAAGALVLALLIGLLALGLAANTMLLAMVATAAEAPSRPAERYTIGGEDVAIYNLAGRLTLEPGEGAEVVVAVTRSGRDADRLRVETGPVGRARTLRVVYPGSRIVYRSLGPGSSSSLRVRDDGTFGDDRAIASLGRSRRVTIAGSGSGTEAQADLVVRVPRGRHLAAHLAVGRIEISNVDGRIEADASAATVTASGTRGSLSIDTGSGTIDVTRADGDVSLDTGSGSIRVSEVHGALRMDTGSGSITGSSLALERLSADTGSGEIDLSDVESPDVSLDTGSGAVRIGLTGEVKDVKVDTGSGGITVRLPPAVSARVAIETSSGAIRTDLPMRILSRDGGSLEGVLGDGRGRITLETGSGGVRLLAK
jgi:DUF4097 and DUF4098 domain-containing protein YvlB